MNSPVAGYIRPGHHAGPRAWLRDAKGAGLMNPWLEKNRGAAENIQTNRIIKLDHLMGKMEPEFS